METKTKVAAVLVGAAALAIGAVALKDDAPVEQDPAKVIAVDWPATVPKNVKCYQGQWVDTNFQGRGFKYEWSTKCNPTEEELAAAVGDLTEVVFDGGAKALRTIDDAAPWPCACSTGRQCERLDNAGAWVDASSWNNVIGPNRWRGAGCLRMACGQLVGAPTPYPAECVQP